MRPNTGQLLPKGGATRRHGEATCPPTCLAAVRHAMHSGIGQHALRRRLRRCVIDDSPRHSSKAAYRWPHKRDHAPPGPPQITRAPRSQVLAAKEFRAATLAA